MLIPDTSSPFNRFLGDRKAYPFCRAKTCVIRGITGELDDTPYLYKGSIESLIVFSMESQNYTYVWLGTNKGLYRLNVESGEIQSFDMFPRLPNSEFAGLSSYQSPVGKLFFGSHEGLWSFHPDRLVREMQD